MTVEAGQTQPLREYYASGCCRSRWDSGLRKATRVAFAVCVEGCPVGPLKTQVPRDCPKEERSLDLSKDTNTSKVLEASEIMTSFERDDDILCFIIVCLIWFCARAQLGKEFVNSITGGKKITKPTKKKHHIMSVNV